MRPSKTRDVISMHPSGPVEGPSIKNLLQKERKIKNLSSSILLSQLCPSFASPLLFSPPVRKEMQNTEGEEIVKNQEVQMEQQNANSEHSPKKHRPDMAATGEEHETSDDDDDDHEDDEYLSKLEDNPQENEERKVGWRSIVEWVDSILIMKKAKVEWRIVVECVAFILIMACLVTSRTVGPWKEKHLWDLELWKWCLMVLVVLSGRLISGWLVGFLAFLIEVSNFLYGFRKKVLYLLHCLRKSVQNCIWLGLVLLYWYIMFDPEVEQSTRKHRSLKRVWRALLAFTIGAIIWQVKIILVKMLASSFYEEAFFDRMEKNVLHHSILEKLSALTCEKRPARKCAFKIFEREEAGFEGKEAGVPPSGGLSSISTTIDRIMKGYNESGDTSEFDARICALKISKNVAKEGEKYIKVDDLSLILEGSDCEVKILSTLTDGATDEKNQKIKKSDFRNWVMQVYRERRALAHSLNDTKTGVKQLHKLASAVVIIIIIVMCLLVMGVATTKVVFLITSQLVLAAFIFGNTCKTVFESIVFVFVMHPFDVGDRCIIDGVQMVVEEKNILTTVFLRFDQEKIYYPNSVLLTKPISNFRRSPEMGDNIEFAIDVSTKAETLTAMKVEIKKYIKKKSKHWKPKHSVVVKEIENVNKMKIVLFVLHTMNHQDFMERNNRRSRFVLKLKRIFESLGIKYQLLPQEVYLHHGDIHT